MSLSLAPQLIKRQTLIEDLVGLGIVVVHRCGRLLRSLRSLLPALTGLRGLSQTVVGHAEEVVEVVLLGTIELALAKMVGIDEALLQQADGPLEFFGGLRRSGVLREFTLCQLHAADLILGRHLAFATLPGMEHMGIEFRHRLLIAAKLIEKRYLLKHQVVALLNEPRILLQEVKALLMRLVQMLVKLIELHKHAGIGLVETEGALHVFESLILTPLLIETGQGEVAPNDGERGIELRRQLPVLNGDVILPLVVIETAEVVRGFGTLNIGCRSLRSFEDKDVLQAVGEAAVAVGLLCLIVTAQVIIGHGRNGILAEGHVPDGTSLVLKSCGSIVEGCLVVVV